MVSRLEFQDFEECSFLKDEQNELEKHKQMSTKNMDVLSVKYDLLSKALEQLLSLDTIDRTENSCLSQAKKLKSQNKTLASQINEVETECEKLMKQCQELPNKLIESRNEALSLSQNLEQMKSEVADLVHDTKERQMKFKLAVESTKMGKLYYKDVLGCHVSRLHVDGNNVEFLFSYNKTRPSSLNPIPPNSIKFSLNSEKKTWRVLETSLSVENFKQLSHKFEESQDIQGLLAHLRPNKVPMN